MAKSHKLRKTTRRNRFVFNRNHNPVMNRNLMNVRQKLTNRDIQEQLEAAREPVATY